MSKRQFPTSRYNLTWSKEQCEHIRAMGILHHGGSKTHGYWQGEGWWFLMRPTCGPPTYIEVRLRNRDGAILTRIKLWDKGPTYERL